MQRRSLALVLAVALGGCTPTTAAAPTATLAAPTGSAAPSPSRSASARLTFMDGTHVVGIDVPPGTYKAPEATAQCRWQRLRGFGGTMDDVIAGGATNGPNGIVTIHEGDLGFWSERCGTWTNDLSALVSPSPPPTRAATNSPWTPAPVPTTRIYNATPAPILTTPPTYCQWSTAEFLAFQQARGAGLSYYDRCRQLLLTPENNYGASTPASGPTAAPAPTMNVAGIRGSVTPLSGPLGTTFTTTFTGLTDGIRFYTVLNGLESGVYTSSGGSFTKAWRSGSGQTVQKAGTYSVGLMLPWPQSTRLITLSFTVTP